MKKTTYLFWSIVLSVVLLPKSHALADVGSPPPESPISFSFTNPFKGGDTLYSFVKTLLNDVVLPIGGVVVVFFIIYSGFLFITARGNTTQLAKARENFLWVVIGSAVLLGAWVIATAVQGTIESLRAA